MFRSLFAFELRSHLRRPTTWLYVATIFLIAFFAVSTDAVIVGPALGKVKKNSPFVLSQVYGIVLAIGQIITSALVGTAVLRDFDAGVHELLFTTRITRRAYLGAKYLAAFLAMLVVFLGLPLGALLGTVMPWVDPETLQGINVWHYFHPYIIVIVPGVFFLSAMLFAVGSLSRSAFSVYVAGILLLVGYSLADDMVRTLDRDQLANLIDPFAMRSFDLVTRYWTPAEKNSQLIPLAGFLGLNRLLWASVGAVLLVITFRFVRLEKSPRSLRRRQKAEKAATTTSSAVIASVPRRAHAAPSVLAGWKSVTWFHARSLLRSTPFLAIAAIGLINVIMSAIYVDQTGQSRSWPMSWMVAEAAVGGASLFMLVLLTFYAGELVWRERQVRLDQVLDSSPVPTASILLGKMSAMVLLLFAFACVSMLGGMIVQIAKGLKAVDVPVYLLYVFGTDFPGWLSMVALAFLVQSLVPKKPIGHVIMIGVWVSTIALGNLGWTYRLIQIGGTPLMTWSDLNGAGPYLRPFASVHGYWLSIGMLLAAFAYLTWQRGTAAESWASRIRSRLNRGTKMVLAGGTLGAGAFGGLFYYNASVINSYTDRKSGEKRQVAYEQTWRKYENLAQPKVVAVSLQVDIEPSVERARAGTSITMINRHSRAIDTMYVDLFNTENDLHAWVDSLTFDRPSRVLATDSVFGVHMLRLDTPLAPGDSLRLRVVQRYDVRGFANGQPDRSLVANGTFFNRDKFPSIGYQTGNELGSDELRRKYKLPPARRAKLRTDSVGLRTQDFIPDADFIRFDAVISTDVDQIAMAPGYLKKEWRDSGRRYFQYEMDSPIPNFFSVLSARWTVTKGDWKGIPIEIYHHPNHAFNVQRMIEASKASLEYFTNEFGPYQHRQLRIIEFPRYAGFAQSFPNTVPYSEAIGFVARVDSSSVEDTDLPYFVTAHEIAHQWFPYQRMAAGVEGSAMLSESLSEYAALVVTERLHGRPFTQKFLRAELDRYLRGRSGETKGERPLVRVDNQAYIHYQKGSLAFFALRDLLGEKALHGAIRSYLDEGRFAGPPYATTIDFMRHLRAATPDSLQRSIDDYFETITLWDVKADSVTSTKRADGQYDVVLSVTAKKLRADSLGTETDVPMDEYVDIGVFDAAKAGARIGAPLAIQKVRVKSGTSRHTFTVKSLPARAGIDPYNLLIDRNPGDNTRDVITK